MKKVLIIPYYFPPLGMGGVQRSLKFVRYLLNFGWEPIVFTTGEMAYYAHDENLLEEIPSSITIYRSNFFNPLAVASKSLPSHGSVEGKEKNKNTTLLSYFKKASSYLSILDNKIFWALFNLPKAIKICKRHNISCIYSTSPPHSIHLLALLLSKILNIPYIIDFRDDWVGGVLDQSPTPFHDNFADSLLRLCLKHARFVTATSRWIGQSLQNRELKKIYSAKMFHVKHQLPKYITITNGYDENDFTNFQNRQTNKFTITYSGSFTPVHHPMAFLICLSKLLIENPEWKKRIQFDFIGQYFGMDLPDLLRQKDLDTITKIHGYKSHKKVIEKLETSNMLILSLTMGEHGKPIVPGKLFEYFRIGKPILAIAPEDGAVAELIQYTNSGSIADEMNLKKIKYNIKKNFLNWQNNVPFPKPTHIEEFERKNLTKKLSQLFDEATQK